MGKARNLSELLDSNGDVKSEHLDNTSAYTKSDTDPTITSNAALGDLWVNYSNNKMWVCTTATTDSNIWTNADNSFELIQPNQPPTNPTNTGTFPISANKDESFSFTFDGATDSISGGPDGPEVTHYLVDNFSSSNLTVTSAEVAEGSEHNFTVGSIGADENFSFRVRAKDNNGTYSSGVTVNITLYAVVFTEATGGTVTTSGDYKYHTFNSSSTFTITTGGNAASGGIDYLVVAGGGGSGDDNSPGAGAGGYIATAGAIKTAGSYTVTVGGGGAGTTSRGTQGGNSAALGTTATGGGHGAEWNNRQGGNGGSGGGSSGTNSGGTGITGQGHNGGAGGGDGKAGGGGGAGGAGANGNSTEGGDGGIGKQWLNGSWYAGGGGGCGEGASLGGGEGGQGGGGNGSNGRDGGSNGGSSGTANTGGGGGGPRLRNGLFNGGSGIVIIRYRFQ